MPDEEAREHLRRALEADAVHGGQVCLATGFVADSDEAVRREMQVSADLRRQLDVVARHRDALLAERDKLLAEHKKAVTEATDALYQVLRQQRDIDEKAKSLEIAGDIISELRSRRFK